MSRLAVDGSGRIYEVNSDRTDGLGAGKYPSCQSQSDTTLGNAYLQAQARRTSDLIRARRQQEILNYQDQVIAAKKKERAAQIKKQDQAQALLQRVPQVQSALLKRAVQMGCPCDESAQMSGKLTANGETGWRGMSRDQKIIHHELVGMGHDVSHRSDPSRVEAHRMQKQAENMMRIKARK